MFINNVEILYEIYIIVFFTYIFYKLLFGKIIYLDKYYIEILKYSPLFWVINIYLPNILSLIILVLYIVFCSLIFAYSNKNIIVLAKKDEYLSFLYGFFDNNDINFNYNRNVYEVELYFPQYEFEIVSNKSLFSYFEIKLPRSISEEEEGIINRIKKDSKSNNLNPGRDKSLYFLIIDILLIIFFYYL